MLPGKLIQNAAGQTPEFGVSSLRCLNVIPNLKQLVPNEHTSLASILPMFLGKSNFHYPQDLCLTMSSLLLLLIFTYLVQSDCGQLAVGICYNSCNAVWLACVVAARVVAEVNTGEAAVPAAVLACN
jgi:hypothetical protein